MAGERRKRDAEPSDAAEKAGARSSEDVEAPYGAAAGGAAVLDEGAADEQDVDGADGEGVGAEDGGKVDGDGDDRAGCEDSLELVTMRLVGVYVTAMLRNCCRPCGGACVVEESPGLGAYSPLADDRLMSGCRYGICPVCRRICTARSPACVSA